MSKKQCYYEKGYLLIGIISRMVLNENTMLNTFLALFEIKEKIAVLVEPYPLQYRPPE